MDSRMAYTRKTVAADQVQSFARRWPCCNFPELPVTFEFDPNGNLVAIEGLDDWTSREGVNQRAVVALAEDAQAGLFDPPGRIIITKEQIDAAFDAFDHQEHVFNALYKLVFPNWDEIEKVDRFPSIGKEASDYIWLRFIKFDREHHPDVMMGGYWLNYGFSTNEKLGPWEISTDDCRVKLLERPPFIPPSESPQPPVP